MGKFLNGLRISVMSVHEGWWYAYLVAFFAQMSAWTIMVAWDEAVYGGHTRVIEYLRAVGGDSSHMVQMFILNTIGIIELGRSIMVLAQGMAERLKQRKEKFRAELITQGKSEGRAELAAEIAVWNEKRLAAEERGEKFDEPPPMQ